METLSVAGLSCFAQSSRVRRQTRYGAAILDIVPMVCGQVVFYLPRESIDMLCFEGLPNRLEEFGIRARHGHCNDLGDEGVLRFEMIIEAALCESGLAHELIEADRVDAAFAK